MINQHLQTAVLSQGVTTTMLPEGTTLCAIAQLQEFIDYLRYLLAQSPNQRLLIFSDGASYHRSKEVRGFLDQVNQNLVTDQWKIHCVRFAPNCPEQNPPIGYLVASQNMGSTFLCLDSFVLSFEVDV
jgi:hypothetical protein